MDLTWPLLRSLSVTPRNNKPSVASEFMFELLIKVTVVWKPPFKICLYSLIYLFFFHTQAAAGCVSQCVHSVSAFKGKLQIVCSTASNPTKGLWVNRHFKVLSRFRLPGETDSNYYFCNIVTTSICFSVPLLDYKWQWIISVFYALISRSF